ncbi:hypothetical protein [Mycolicibacter sinensis]|uniref:Uncharacterized protein n=1 Tax=Mycolicibacter sinensis (strain JDM601) TaxID=875328 RepID=A0A1A2E9X9_MYCSD|nr:hypothetical protein [Mycolicibacter sinensis]OBF95449.1 hypothetical protein A5772_17905 [Mycolicibacter sinensis]OBG01932.1 hypothetical protein A5771_16150 [Mycolicibacter sinensis]
MRLGNVLGTVAFIWLLIGAIAVWQRGYLENAEPTCRSAGTIALTVLAGPLNYGGVNPQVAQCELPQPSSLPDRSIEHLIGMESP